MNNVQRSIGFCQSWSELEKRRRAIDLFLQRQLEVVGGIPQKVFYECGATTDCPYKVIGVRDEKNRMFELFEVGGHSHEVRPAANSVFLVDQPPNEQSSSAKIEPAKNTPAGSPKVPKCAEQNDKNGADNTSTTSKLSTIKASLRKNSINSPAESSPRGRPVKRTRQTSGSSTTGPGAKKPALTKSKSTGRGAEASSDNENSRSDSTASSVGRLIPKRKLPTRVAKRLTKQSSFSSKPRTRGSLNAREESNESKASSSNNSRMNKSKPMSNELTQLLLDKASMEGKTTLRRRQSNPAAKAPGSGLTSAKNRNSTSMIGRKSPVASRQRSPATNRSTPAKKFSSASTNKIGNGTNASTSNRSSPMRNNATRGEKASMPELTPNKTPINNQQTRKPKIKTEDGLVWTWWKTVSGDANLVKFRESNRMHLSSHFRWRCFRAIHPQKCQYKMLIQKEDDIKPPIYQIFTNGGHNHGRLETMQYRRSDRQNDEKGKGADTDDDDDDEEHWEGGGRTSMDKGVTPKELSEKNGPTTSKRGQKMVEDKGKTYHLERTAMATIAELREKRRGEGGGGTESRNSNVGTAQSASRRLPIRDLPNNDARHDQQQLEQSSSSAAPVGLDKEGMNRNLALIDSMEGMDRMEYPREWHFSIIQNWETLTQLARELGLKVSRSQNNNPGVIFSSKDANLIGQLLIFSDQLNSSDRFVKVAEYGDWQLVKEEQWPKALLSPFLYAVRGKCMQFFFEIPNTSVTSEDDDDDNGRESEKGTSGSNGVKREMSDPIGANVGGKLQQQVNGTNQANGEVECPVEGNECGTTESTSLASGHYLPQNGSGLVQGHEEMDGQGEEGEEENGGESNDSNETVPEYIQWGE